MATTAADSRPVSGEPVLRVQDLRVQFVRRGTAPVRAVDGVDFEVARGEVIGIVGESGSGKSVTSMAIMGLLPDRGVQVSGVADYRGENLLTMPARQLARLRGDDLAMIFQDPMSSLNPVMTVGAQVSEVLHAHEKIGSRAARDQSIDLLRRCGIPDPARRYREYPHQLSGGMRQRVLIAIALACRPQLLICDEPTTALDVTIQAQILELLAGLTREIGASMIMITHDLGVVAGLCDRVNVMYAGRIVETANRRELFARPRHRYTVGLLSSIPRLDAPRAQRLTPIPGTPRDTVGWDQACAFAPRCQRATDDCVTPDLGFDGSASHRWRCLHPAQEDTP